ncbi:MAG: phenylalanine--tRNA ligase subunit alpha [bacterium]|nr:phenylalanine--tRNA ligase subunit alpha [bacterium]
MENQNQPKTKGHLHPMTQFIRNLVSIFEKNGFEVATGPEVETEWNNFDFLNVPADHPSRDTQDTFWLTNGTLLRTHTTTLQARIMQNRKPPVRFIMPGKIYRNEATDQTHEAIFYQLDGFAIDKYAKLTDLLGTLEDLFIQLLGEKTEVRFRPHLFPFVEPGVEMDLKWKGKWMEMAGAGMIHPKVLTNMGLNPDDWQGFAFGIGLDRFLMSYYGIDDIRLLHKNDLRFLDQF